MKNTNEQMRLMISFLCLLVLLSTAFSMALMAQAEPITPEDYDGLVILEDPALLGDSEDEGKTESPATEPPVTEVPTTEAPTTEPTREPASACGSPFGAVLGLGSLRSPAGKKASIAHFAGGAHNVARNGVGQLSPALEARSCSLFSSFKKGKAFSLRCLSPLCSPTVGVGQAQPTQVGMLHCSLDNFAAQKTVLFFSSAVGTIHT